MWNKIYQGSAKEILKTFPDAEYIDGEHLKVVGKGITIKSKETGAENSKPASTYSS